MITITQGWELDVERGPGWLFVRPHGATEPVLNCADLPAASSHRAATVNPAALDAADLADDIWALLEQNFSRRLVLELDQIQLLNSTLIGQLMRLSKRMALEDGVLRICGLSEDNQRVLDNCRLVGFLPCFDSRADAVMATRPAQPR